MLETISPTTLIQRIENIITSKKWYSLTESNRFVWEHSVDRMARMISEEIKTISPHEIRSIIENSFTQEALSKAGGEYFIDCLLKIDQQLILWSEGDPEWQKLKATKTGLLEKQGLTAEFISKNKIDKLKKIVLSLAKENGEEVCVVVIDDKPKNLNHASDLQNEVAESGITIKTFLLSLKNTVGIGNPETCLKFISEMQTESKNIRIIVDMDGVIVDTDSVLANAVPKKIAQILEKK